MTPQQQRSAQAWIDLEKMPITNPLRPEKKVGSLIVTKQIPAVCAVHGEVTALQAEINGTLYTLDCPECHKARMAEREEEQLPRYTSTPAAIDPQEEKKRRFIAALTATGLPEKHLRCRLASYRADSEGAKKALAVATAYAENFGEALAKGRCLTFCGKPGTGKTHLAAAIIASIIQRGHTAKYIRISKALRRVKSTYAKDSSEKEQDVYDAYASPDLLVIDEIGVQYGTDAEKNIIFEIIDSRYELAKPTLIVSNLLPAEIGNVLGTRILDRLRDNGGEVLSFSWGSYRK